MTGACYGFASNGKAACQTPSESSEFPEKKSLFPLPSLRVDTPKYTNTVNETPCLP